MALDPKLTNTQFQTVSYEIGSEKVKEFIRAIKADPNKFTNLVPPTFAVVYGTELLEAVLFHPDLKLNLNKLVHGEQHFIYHKAVRAGDTISSSGKIEKIFQKGVHDFIVFKVSSSNQHNEIVCESIWTFVVRGGNDSDFSFSEKIMMKLASLMPQCKKVPHKHSQHLSKAQYDPIDGNNRRMTVEIDRYMPQRYAGASGDFNAIHLDAELGKSVGLGGYILHGMASMGMGANLALLNKDAADIKSYKTRFSAPVKPFDLLTYQGTFSDDQKTFSFNAVNQNAAEVLSNSVIEFA